MAQFTRILRSLLPVTYQVILTGFWWHTVAKLLGMLPFYGKVVALVVRIIPNDITAQV